MNSVQTLPEGYEVIEKMELQKDKKTMLLVNGLAVAIFVVMSVIMNIICPLPEWFMSPDRGSDIGNLLIISLGYIAYIVLHEFTHGAAMKYFGGQKVDFGFTGMYAFAGSKVDYFARKPYIVISLAPVVLWGIVFTVLMIVFPGYLWSLYFLQMGNMAGAAGDFYVTWKMLHMPEDVYVQDTGVSMTVYSRTKVQ
ncbi:MAG: DUF3267 domain-containing protein [Erysipelotrichaceae bacterium]|nr:DUF3267 domain-containing protein [Erysipelotrichaceae bacterium]